MTSFFKFFATIICLLIVAGAAAPCASAARHGEVSHVVVLWLKHPGNTAEEDALIRASKSFSRIRGVQRVEVGRSIPVSRPGIDQPFDLCAIITFKNQLALARFQTDERHMQAVELFLKPLVRRYVVYNFVSE